MLQSVRCKLNIHMTEFEIFKGTGVPLAIIIERELPSTLTINPGVLDRRSIPP
jgi:hypothetical protein